MFKILLLAVVALHAAVGHPVKTHPPIPQETCVDLRPGSPAHNNGAEDNSDFFEQYEFKVSKSEVSSTGSVKFTIKGKDGNTFRGFMIQVRAPGSTEPIGKFIVDPSDPDVAAMSCGDEEKNLALIKFPVPPNKFRDLSEVTVTWKPNGYKGKVNFVATVMKVAQVFWVARKSEDITVN